MGKNEIKGVPTIADLYPELSPEEQADVENRFKEYLRIVKRIWDRYEQEDQLPELRALFEKRRLIAIDYHNVDLSRNPLWTRNKATANDHRFGQVSAEDATQNDLFPLPIGTPVRDDVSDPVLKRKDLRGEGAMI